MTDYKPGDIQPLAYSVGTLAITFSQLEYVIDGVIGYLLDIDGPRRIAVTARLTAEARVDMLNNCISHWPRAADLPEVVKKFKQFSDEFDECRQKRNLYVHALWGHVGNPFGPFKFMKFQSRGPVKAKPGEASVNKILDASLRAAKLQIEIMRYFDASPALHDWFRVSPPPEMAMNQALISALAAPPPEQSQTADQTTKT